MPVDYYKSKCLLLILIDFLKTFLTFKSQVVYCPKLKISRNLTLNLAGLKGEALERAIETLFENISVEREDWELSDFSDFSFAGTVIEDK